MRIIFLEWEIFTSHISLLLILQRVTHFFTEIGLYLNQSFKRILEIRLCQFATGNPRIIIILRKNFTHYALQPDGSAYFSYPYIPSSSFSIQLENGLSTAVLHEGCFQFFMEDQDGQCFKDTKTSLCEAQGGSTMNDYKEWLVARSSSEYNWASLYSHSSSPSPPHLVTSTETNQPMEMTTVEEERTTAEEERSTTVSTTEEKTTTVEEEKMTTTEKNEEERSTTSSQVTEGERTTTSMEWTTERTIPTTKTTTVTIPTIPTNPMTTIPPTNIFYASIVLEEVTTQLNFFFCDDFFKVTIGIEKNVDESTKDCKIVFEVKAVFSSRPSYKIYIDTIELVRNKWLVEWCSLRYPYGTPFQVVRHNVGEVLNVTIASGTEKITCVELEVKDIISFLLRTSNYRFTHQTAQFSNWMIVLNSLWKRM